ncbi:MAG: prolipoprotein diacylglyceryl transferase, partial [Candidatus Tectimicrobiota bacterium]
RYYGLMYAVAILVGIALIRRDVRRRGLSITDDDVVNFVLIGVAAGILGARAYYVAFNWDFYGRHWSEIPAIWHGGLAIHGGLAAGVLAGGWFIRRHGLSALLMGDVAAPSLILGQAFGRFGNFMNGDAHGVPTAMPWGVVFPSSSIAGQEFPNTPTHPTMLYEMVLNLMIFGLLYRLRLRPTRDGFLSCLYLVLYSAGRFVVSFFRADSLMVGPLRAAHVVSVLLIAIAGGYIVKERLWQPRTADAA